MEIKKENRGVGRVERSENIKIRVLYKHFDIE